MSIIKIRIVSQSLAFVALLMISGFASADWRTEYQIQGYDPVSYFTDTGPLSGDPEFTSKYGDQLFAFSSMENLDQFSLYPEAYLPAYDGNCAFGVVYGMRSTVDPLVWEIVDNRLFLLINHSTKKRWNRKSTNYIKKGDRNWVKMVESSI